MMITVPFWVLPTLLFAGTGLAGFCATIWRAHIDAQILARTPEPAPEPEPVPQPWQAPTPPWADHSLSLPVSPPPDTSWRGFGIRPDGSEFAGEPTVSFQAIGFPMPEPKPKPVDDEVKPTPRSRFTEPTAPVEVVVTTKVGDVVASDRCEVTS